MKLNNFHLSRLRNDEHFQFLTELRDAIVRFGAPALKIEAQYNEWLPVYAQEDEALKKIMKSAITAEIQAADQRRDQLFRGMVDVSRSALNHFRPDVQEAARRLKILFDTYGNVAQKPLNEQTSAVYNLLQDIKDKFAAEAQQVAITDWAAELETANQAFASLMKDRYEESAMKTDLVLRQVRLRADELYRLIIERINALVVVEGAEPYAEFIRFWNTVIAKYATIVAQRAGRKKNG